MRSITVRIISTEECRRLTNNDPAITEADHICTHDATLKQHASHGDESNPLNDLENTYLYGIMLWTLGRGFPDVYLNLHNPVYYNWLVDEITKLAVKQHTAEVLNSRHGQMH